MTNTGESQTVLTLKNDFLFKVVTDSGELIDVEMQREAEEARNNLTNAAIKLKARGMGNDEISGITGLSAEEIAKL